jgi:hypothetical protein
MEQKNESSLGSVIKIKCDRCTEEFDELGGLAFSPPRNNGTVDKYHLCVKCWYGFMDWKQNE